MFLLPPLPDPPALATPTEAPPAPAVALEEQIVEQAIAYAQAQSARLPGSYRFRLLQKPVVPRMVEGEVRIEVSHLSKRDPSGRFFVAMKLLVAGRMAGYTRVDLEGLWTGSLLRAKENLPRKALPDPARFETVSFEGPPPPGALARIPEGQRLRQPLQAGRYLTQADLEAIPLVKAGDRVRLTVAAENLSIITDGLARNSAALGERVRIELSGTRKLVLGVVSGEGEARLAGFQETK